MALDVWVGQPGKLWSKLVASFEPEAFYAFLAPLFEDFAEDHGQSITPYDGAIFQYTELAPVLELADKAGALVASQDDKFEVHMGTNLGTYHDPKNEEIYETVAREEFLALHKSLAVGH